MTGRIYDAVMLMAAGSIVASGCTSCELGSIVQEAIAQLEEQYPQIFTLIPIEELCQLIHGWAQGSIAAAVTECERRIALELEQDPKKEPDMKLSKWSGGTRMGFCGKDIWPADGRTGWAMPAFEVMCEYCTAAINEGLAAECVKRDISLGNLTVAITPAAVRAFELATDGDVPGMIDFLKEIHHWEHNVNTGPASPLKDGDVHTSEMAPKHNLAYAAIMLALYYVHVDARHLGNLNLLRQKYGAKTLLHCVRVCFMRKHGGYEPVPEEVQQLLHNTADNVPLTVGMVQACHYELNGTMPAFAGHSAVSAVTGGASAEDGSSTRLSPLRSSASGVSSAGSFSAGAGYSVCYDLTGLTDDTSDQEAHSSLPAAPTMSGSIPADPADSFAFVQHNAAPPRRHRCQHGSKCYRRGNPVHNAEYSHPGDHDYRRPKRNKLAADFNATFNC